MVGFIIAIKNSGQLYVLYVLSDLKNSLLRLENIEKDNQKLQKIQEKSRKAKDVEMLFAENDLLQKRIISQEEQFRIQNQTLMDELTLVPNIILQIIAILIY